MEKMQADSIIEYYMRPMYGFALKKMGNLAEAEELAAQIILEVYQVLCYKEDFIDINNYVSKIAHNVWVRYLKEKTKKKCETTLEDPLMSNCAEEIYKKMIDEETKGLLRREIAYLSRQQRNIIVDYYYKRKSIKEIASEMDLSEGTIKWNLFDIKKELKVGMRAIRTVGSLGINPIRFASMGHSGIPGERGDTRDFLSKVITQNIAYAAYHEPRSIKEIAEELGVSPVFIEDEIHTLEEYGFMERLPGGKYRTQIVIEDPLLSEKKAVHKLNKKYAKIFYEKYYKELLSLEDKINQIGFYYPDQDYNCLLWTLIPYVAQFLNFKEDERIKDEDVLIYRKDGGKYIAIARIDKALEVNYDEQKYISIYMRRGSEDEKKVQGWQVWTFWSGRNRGWRDNKYSDYVSMMYFIKGKLVENEVTEEVYSRLIEKEYLIQEDHGYKVNIVYFENKNQVEKLESILPRPSDEIRQLSLEYEQQIYEIKRRGYPSHVHKALRSLTQGSIISNLIPYVLEEMLQQGVLRLPTEKQRKGISTILFLG